MQAKPVVDGIERELGGRANIVRVDLLSRGGQDTARRYGVDFSPTFLFFDRGGKLVEVTRALRRDEALGRLRS